MSVAKLVKAGNTVVFSPSGSYIYDEATQEYLSLQENQGMYTLALWVRPGDVPRSGF